VAEYRIRETGEVIVNLAAAFPNVSLPAALSEEDFDLLGVDPVFEGAQPMAGKYQSVIRDGVEDIEGQWFTKYVLVDLDDDAKAALDQQALEGFYQQRASKLAATDWWAIRASEPGGLPMTEAQASYRQALRDLDDAEGFDPYNPNWPEMPA
jgi:hypothetical protein